MICKRLKEAILQSSIEIEDAMYEYGKECANEKLRLQWCVRDI